MIKKSRSKLWLYFTLIVFGTISVTFLCLTSFWFILYHFRIIPAHPEEMHIPFILFMIGSAIIGSVITIFVGKLIIIPVVNISEAFNDLSKGDFSVRVPNDEKIVEIREMADRFNAMVYDLSHIETLRNDFVANVSHEFKTPIAAIEGYATLLQDDSLDKDKHDHYVEKIIDNSRRLSELSSNILSLSKLENQEMVINQKDYRLDEQLRKTVLLLENKWSSKSIEFDIDLPKQIFYGNEPLLYQVWFNILDNAIKYSPTGGIIQITLTNREKEISVSISDEGSGMTEEVQKHIFEKFYQGDVSRKAEGNGLGLALVKRIVDLCKGTVTVNSKLGAGTTFTVTLPL